MKNRRTFKKIIIAVSIVTALAVSAVTGAYALEKTANVISDITSTTKVSRDASCGKDFLQNNTTGIIKADGKVYLYNSTTECASEKPMDTKDLQVLFIDQEYTGKVNAEDYNGVIIIHSKVESTSGAAILVKENEGKTVSGVLLANGKVMECTNNNDKINLGSKELDIMDVTDLYISTDIDFNADNLSISCPKLSVITTFSGIPTTI